MPRPEACKHARDQVQGSRAWDEKAWQSRNSKPGEQKLHKVLFLAHKLSSSVVLWVKKLVLITQPWGGRGWAGGGGWGEFSWGKNTKANIYLGCGGGWLARMGNSENRQMSQNSPASRKAVSGFGGFAAWCSPVIPSHRLASGCVLSIYTHASGTCAPRHIHRGMSPLFCGLPIVHQTQDWD